MVETNTVRSFIASVPVGVGTIGMLREGEVVIANIAPTVTVTSVPPSSAELCPREKNRLPDRRAKRNENRIKPDRVSSVCVCFCCAILNFLMILIV